MMHCTHEWVKWPGPRVVHFWSGAGGAPPPQPPAFLELAAALASQPGIELLSSPVEAIRAASRNPGCEVVLLAAGFETAAPAAAMALWQARRLGLCNFSALIALARIPPAMRLLLDSGRADGFLAPGHVCTPAAYREYESIAAAFRIPIVVAGFEPADMRESLSVLRSLLEAGRSGVRDEYSRSRSRAANLPALPLLEEVFDPAGRCLRLRLRYAPFDAARRFACERVC